MKKFNLTEKSLNNRSILVYMIVCIFIAGAISYSRLGRMENPDFTIRQMVVTVSWPGATSEQMQKQVIDKIERKLQETPDLGRIESYSRANYGVVQIFLQETSPAESVRDIWKEARNLVNDMRGELPQGVVGPFFNDRFDDVFGTIYTLTTVTAILAMIPLMMSNFWGLLRWEYPAVCLWVQFLR